MCGARNSLIALVGVVHVVFFDQGLMCGAHRYRGIMHKRGALCSTDFVIAGALLNPLRGLLQAIAVNGVLQRPSTR